MSGNKVHYDLVDVHVAPLSFDGGKAVFGIPRALPGSISLMMTAQGDTVRLRADGVDYYRAASNGGYRGELRLALVPIWFRQAYLGEVMDPAELVSVEHTGFRSKPFALIFGFKGDRRWQRHVLYSCMASRPRIRGENKPGRKDPAREVLRLDAAPLPDGSVKASTTAETPDAVYNAWVKRVWVGSIVAVSYGVQLTPGVCIVGNFVPVWRRCVFGAEVPALVGGFRPEYAAAVLGEASGAVVLEYTKDWTQVVAAESAGAIVGTWEGST